MASSPWPRYPPLSFPCPKLWQQQLCIPPGYAHRPQVRTAVLLPRSALQAPRLRWALSCAWHPPSLFRRHTWLDVIWLHWTREPIQDCWVGRFPGWWLQESCALPFAALEEGGWQRNAWHKICELAASAFEKGRREGRLSEGWEGLEVDCWRLLPERYFPKQTWEGLQQVWVWVVADVAPGNWDHCVGNRHFWRDLEPHENSTGDLRKSAPPLQVVIEVGLDLGRKMDLEKAA